MTSIPCGSAGAPAPEASPAPLGSPEALCDMLSGISGVQWKLRMLSSSRGDGGPWADTARGGRVWQNSAETMSQGKPKNEMMPSKRVRSGKDITSGEIRT